MVRIAPARWSDSHHLLRSVHGALLRKRALKHGEKSIFRGFSRGHHGFGTRSATYLLQRQALKSPIPATAEVTRGRLLRPFVNEDCRGVSAGLAFQHVGHETRCVR